MNRKVIVEEFSMKKEVTKLVLSLLTALIMGVFAFLYLYFEMYFRAGFIGIGALGWCWLSFLCIREIVIAKKRVEKSRVI